MIGSTYLSKEEELLTTIATISSRENAIEYKNRFCSANNVYSIEAYLEILDRIINLLSKGIKDIKQVIYIIENNGDNLI